jgi:LuxR family maltose regulon positive regulatory protein
MNESLITTKLLVPTTRADIVTRRHLIDVLHQSLSHKLTLVSAPAGFGKTTLIGDWINQQGVSAVWLTLDEFDNDPIRFLLYFIRALQAIHPDFGETILEIIQSPQAQINEPLLTALINEIASAISMQFVYVLDDYHLAESSGINQIIAFLLDYLPPLMHLVIATRSAPSLPVSLLRGRGELLEIRQGDLRFTNEETAEFLTQNRGLGLTPQQVVALRTRTEGWISGLQMAVISMQRHENVSEFIQSFTGSNRYIFDYLIEEILNRQPDNIQDFLLKTSILERLSAGLCDQVMDHTDGQSILDYLERANLFIVPLDDDRNWYRYHRLFADLLQKQLLQKQPGHVGELHKRASLWFDKKGFYEAAITHALATRDYEFAADLLEQNIPVMLGRGENLSLIEKIFAKLPEEFVRDRPILSIQQIWGMVFTGRLDEAEQKFRQVENKPGIANDKLISGHIALIRALIANIRGDMGSAIALAHRADELLPPDDMVVRGMILFILGNGYLEVGNLNQAEWACEQIKGFGIASDNLWAKTVAYHRLAQIKKLRGHLKEAQALCEELLQTAALRKAERYGFLCGIYFELGDVLRESNHLDSAMKMVTQGLELSESWGIPTDLVSGNTTLARICLAQADINGAADAIRKAKKAREMGNIFRVIQTKLDTCQVLVWLQQGNLNAASHWAEEIEAKLNNFDPDGQFDFISEMEFIGLARVWKAIGINRNNRSSLDKSKLLLSKLASSAQVGQRMYRLIEILVLRAVVEDHLGDEHKAFEVLEKSISLAQPEGCLRLFLDEGQTMQDILYRAQEKGIRLPYTQTLLAAFDVHRGQLSKSASPALPEPLSDREMEVLILLPTKMTAAEIAERLYIAKSTVDTHIKHIYSKLGVNRRLEAIQRAKELGIL